MKDSKDSPINFGNLNICSLRNKVPDLCVFLSQRPQLVHLFAVNETRLDSSFSDSQVRIPNYSVFRRDSKRSGQTGIACYVHHSIADVVKRRTDLEDENIECLWTEVKNGHASPILVGCIYRNPAETSEWIDNFVSLMDRVKVHNAPVILL